MVDKRSFVLAKNKLNYSGNPLYSLDKVQYSVLSNTANRMLIIKKKPLFFCLSLQSSHVGHLKEVILLHQYHKLYRLTNISFEVRKPSDSHLEELNHLHYTTPPVFHVPGECTVKVTVNFDSTVFGSFPQCLAFNFGQKSHLAVRMNIDVGTEAFLQEVTKERDKLRFDQPLWDDSTKQIIKFEPRPPDSTDESEELLARFKLPPRPEVIVPSSLMTGDQALNWTNYRRVMHQLLFVEEYSMRQEISR